MELLEKLESQIGKSVRDSGWEMYGRDSFQILAATADVIVIAVLSFVVSLEKSRDAVVYSCGCRNYVEMGRPCPHV